MLKVLVIEDDKLLQKALNEKLRRENFEVLLAADGKEGVVMAKSDKPDFILLDLMMPVMRGDVALAQLKHMSETSNIPVAILTVVPKGVLQMDDPQLFGSVVGFWEKDKMSLDEIVGNIKLFFGYK